MHPMLNIAIRAIRKAGDFINYYYTNSSSYSNSFFRYIVKKTEFLIFQIINKAYPDHTIISLKNKKNLIKNKKIQWIIDPISGTTNYIKKFPHFSLSIAIIIDKKIEVSIIYDCLRNELFSAVRGENAQLNGYRIRIDKTKKVKNIVIATSNLFFQKFFFNNLIKNLFKKYKIHFRNTGNKKLDLAYICCSRIDAYFEYNTKKTSNIFFAAEKLILRSSGALITDFFGGHNYSPNNIIVGNPKIVEFFLTKTHELSKNFFLR